VSKAGTDYVWIYDLQFNVDNTGTTPNTVTAAFKDDALEIFDTRKVFMEMGAYNSTNDYTPANVQSEVIDLIKRYEAVDVHVNVTHLFVYRENYLWSVDHPGNPGDGPGPIDFDRRILSPSDISSLKNALAGSTLRCKNSVKIIQLLGAGYDGGPTTWLDERMDQPYQSVITSGATVRNYLKANFDGVGLELHIGNHDPVNGDDAPDGPDNLAAMANMSKWCADNNKTSFVFMGGPRTTYVSAGYSQRTYDFLWSEMSRAGVSYQDSHIVYYRQGRRGGKQVAESEDTLSTQQRAVIKQVKENLLAGWANGDVNAGGGKGGASYDSSASPVSYTVRGCGADIGFANGAGSSSDGCHMAYRQLNGNFQITARVNKISGPDYVDEPANDMDPYAKAGLMIRDSLAGGSRQMSITLSPFQNENVSSDDQIIGQYRTATNGTTVTGFGDNTGTPRYLRLRRVNGVTSSFFSVDKVTWTPFQTGITVPMADPVFVGMTVSSHKSNGVLTTANFTEVQIQALP
jgi:hypothetical protein